MKPVSFILIIALGLFVTPQQVFPQNLTFTTNTFAVGGHPISIVAADVNGDDKLDLIIANYAANTLAVLTNNGQSGFGLNAMLNVGSGPRCVSTADINGDSKADLICANMLGNTLTVLTNNGRGSFSLSSTLSVGSSPSSVVAADVNRDGKPDIICTDYDDNILVVLTNNGSGDLRINAAIPVGNNPFPVSAADVNSDGQPDLICGNLGDCTLTVLTNNGSGHFGSNATLYLKIGPLAAQPLCIATADVNEDGKPDLVTSHVGNNALIVLTNNGSGAYGSNATLDVDPGPDYVTAADINGDGKLDLISANWASTLTVLTNNNNGRFSLSANLNVHSNALCVAAADVNGDGKLDLISANGNGNTLTVLMNTSVFPPPTFTPTLTIAHQGNDMQVAWPSDSPGWSLQQSPDLTRTNWLPSGYGGWPITDDATNKCFAFPSPGGNLFFRLLHP
jgi:hypothetical protein